MKWPRYAEVLLGTWLIVSAFVLPPERPAFQAVNITAGAMILFLDLLSITLRARYAYLGILGVTAAVLLYTYFALPPQAQATQSNVITGLLLLMFAILPTEASKPPESWREFRR